MATTKTCYVSMGFGKKTDFETGRTLDLNLTYNYIIKPAVTVAGLQCIRADEIVHAGPINVPLYEQLLNADLVIVDLSTANKNALYELGVRHALRPYSTIVICEDGLKTFPFDTNHVLIYQYHHLGDSIDFEEVERFRTSLTEAIVATQAADGRYFDSPVYTFLKNLYPPRLGASPATPTAEPPAAARAPAPEQASIGTLMEQSEAAIAIEDWDQAKQLLERVRSMKDSRDSYVLQRLALATYRSRKPTQREAVQDARNILAALDPGTLNDPEVLSIWGAIHKRQWELLEDPSALDTALSAFEKAFNLRGDYQDGITLAFLLNIRAAISDGLEATADFIAAQRVRREVATACAHILEESQKRPRKVDEYAVRAALAEAWFGLGEDTRYAMQIQQADAVAPHPSLRENTQDRIARLGLLLESSPLKYLALP